MPLNVTVPLRAVKVPEFEKLPPTVTLKLPTLATSSVPEVMVKSPALSVTTAPNNVNTVLALLKVT